MATPLVSAAHNLRATLVRSIEITNGQVQVNDAPNIPPFWVGLRQSGLPRGIKYGITVSGLAPRQSPPAMLRHALGLTGPSVELRAGYRANVLSRGLLELLDNGVEITTGSRTVAIEHAIAPVESLYPESGIISDMDGNPISNVELAVWGPVETHDITAGEFEEYQGNAPIEFSSILMRNVDIMVGTTRYRIIAAEPDLGVMTVHLRLRKADEPLAP